MKIYIDKITNSGEFEGHIDDEVDYSLLDVPLEHNEVVSIHGTYVIRNDEAFITRINVDLPARIKKDISLVSVDFDNFPDALESLYEKHMKGGLGD